MTTAIFITVRMKSTRLPKKAMLEIKGRPVIEHLIDRLKQSRLADFIVLCTSTNPNDAILAETAEKCGIRSFKGSEDDVLERYLQAAGKYKVDYIVSLTGDCPFTDAEYVDKTIELYRKTNADFIMCKQLPHGAYSYGIKVEALKKVCEIKDETDTEIWGKYFTETGIFRVEYLKVDDPDLRHPEIRMTLDYPEDFEFFKEVFDRLYKPGKIFTLKEIMELLKRDPQIMKINAHCEELYAKRVQQTVKMKLKKDINLKSK